MKTVVLKLAKRLFAVKHELFCLFFKAYWITFQRILDINMLKYTMVFVYTLVCNRFAAVSFTDLCNETIGPEADILKYSNRSLMSIRSVCVLSQSTKHCQESCNISSPIPLKLVRSCIRLDTSDNSSLEKEGLHTRKELHKFPDLSQSNLFNLLRR